MENVNAVNAARVNARTAAKYGDAMVSTGLNPGESASRKDTSLKVQIFIIANNNDNYEYALAA